MKKKSTETLNLETELLQAKIRNINAQADKTEFKTAITRKEYVSAESVKKLWAKNVLNTKQKLLALPQKAAPLLTGLDVHEIQNILAALVNEALIEMADYDSGALL